MSLTAVRPEARTEVSWDHGSPGEGSRIGLWGPNRAEVKAPWYERQPWRASVSWQVPKGMDRTEWMLAYVACYGADGLVAKVHALTPYVRMRRGDTFTAQHAPGVK